MSGIQADERREHARFPIHCTLEVLGRDQVQPVRLLDISGGGFRFEAEAEFRPETLIRLILDFFPVDIPLRALVAWVKPAPEGRFEHGAEFVNLPRAERSLLRDFIHESQEP